MSCKIVRFDNDYMYYPDGEYLTDENGALIASLGVLIRELQLNPKEMSDIQLWVLCDPIIRAYQLGIERTEKKIAKKLLQVFDIKEEILKC